jgi:hypothetical protein
MPASSSRVACLTRRNSLRASVNAVRAKTTVFD